MVWWFQLTSIFRGAWVETTNRKHRHFSSRSAENMHTIYIHTFRDFLGFCRPPFGVAKLVMKDHCCYPSHWAAFRWEPICRQVLKFLKPKNLRQKLAGYRNKCKSYSPKALFCKSMLCLKATPFLLRFIWSGLPGLVNVNKKRTGRIHHV